MSNLISKRIGINDHFPIDKFSKSMFPENKVYKDIIKNKTDTEPEQYGDCMKNVYRSDDWIKAWIKCEVNREIGKDNAYYVYCIDYSGIGKPSKKYVEDKNINILYERANGVMYYDFDNIGKDKVDIIKRCFQVLGSQHHAFRWFETSWSGNGCHIRIQTQLKFYNKAEWQFIYMYYLDILMKELEHHIEDIHTWYKDNTIDWSCATITRGFAIPYNENGVIENDYFELKSLSYKTLKDLEILINAYCFGWWHDEIKEKFLKNINYHSNENNENKKFVTKFNVDSIDVSKIKEQDGERFNYNWRLKCVTTLMNIYEGDKEKVRNACKFIYSFIKPYKNHTYEEMIGDELENKIFANGDMTYCASYDIIDDLNKYFGFNISKGIKTNEVYVSHLLQTIYKNI